MKAHESNQKENLDPRLAEFFRKEGVKRVPIQENLDLLEQALKALGEAQHVLSSALGQHMFWQRYGREDGNSSPSTGE